MVGHLTLLFLCPQVVEQHHSLISFASGERSAPQISCKWAHPFFLVEAWCILVVCCSAVGAGILHRYVRSDIRFAPRLSCSSSSLTGTKSLPLNPLFIPGKNFVVWASRWMALESDLFFWLVRYLWVHTWVNERVTSGYIHHSLFNKVLVAGVRGSPSWTWEVCKLSW